MSGFLFTTNLYVAVILVLVVVVLISVVFNIYTLKNSINNARLLEENRKMMHTIIDQSETIYWDCDFYNIEKEPFFEDKYEKSFEDLEDIEQLEELEFVEDAESLEELEVLGEGHEGDGHRDVQGEHLGSGTHAGHDSASRHSIGNHHSHFANSHSIHLSPQPDFAKLFRRSHGFITPEIIREEYRNQYIQLLKDFINLKTKEHIEIDIPIIIKDIKNNVQKETWKHIIFNATRIENNKVVKAICLLSDITNQKRIEENYQNVIKYQSFAQQSYPAYTRLNLSRNRVLERYINIQEFSNDLRERTATAELNYINQVIKFDNQNQEINLERERMIINFQSGSRKKQCQFYYKFANGELQWFNLSIELLSNPANGDIEVYIYLKDITNQTISAITKDEVLHEDVEYILWYNKVTNVCSFINKSDAVDWVTDARSISYDEFISRFLQNKVPEQDRNNVYQQFKIDTIVKLLESQEDYRFTCHTRKKDGSVEIKQHKIYNYGENTNIIIFVCTDITQITITENEQNEKLAQAIKQAEIANASKSDFLSRMSHDLRTPMNGIIGITQLCKKELNNPAALEKDLTKIMSSSSYMLGLLNDILDMSKIESGKMEIRPSKVNFGELLENIITLANVMCEDKKVDFTCNKKPENYKHLIINIDRLHCQQVIMNLISNAVKFTPEGGLVELLFESEILEDEKVKVQIQVKDSGVGMTEEFQKVMYDSFTQDKNSINKVGTGLGLAIVKNLVRLMNGTIDCVSSPNCGTTFTINIVIDKVINQVPINSTELIHSKYREQKEKCTLKGKRVLLVEDNELNQEIASRLLEGEGMKVQIAENGLVALNTFTDSAPDSYDVILMDVMMPVMNGLQSTSLLRALDRQDAKTIPIIAMTANAFTEDIENCLKAGMNTHIAKPIDKDKMFDTIKEYIYKSKNV